MIRFFEALRKRESRLTGLLIFTGLVVAFVHHDLEPHRVVWDSFVEFLSSWFIHTLALAVLSAFAYIAIFWFHKFFLGEDLKDFSDKHIWFYIWMTVLVVSVCIFMIAGDRLPSYEDY
jgi:hypothetical protein